ncbi:hypothetical protein GCM10009546_28340 [Actinomadura livida]|uniref:Uncharacterized protein n=1 Tax=Actinomadura livida TaxID=79909 RepID=A0ABN1EDR4_9ACTN
MRIPSAEGVGVSVENGPARVARSFAHARAVADAILYEGYLLYPYRRSSGKNRVRWQFGVIVPPAWADAHGLTDTSVAGSAEAPWQQTECLLSAPDDAAVTCRVRFLQTQRKSVEERLPEGSFHPADFVNAGERMEVGFDEAVPQEFDFRIPLRDLRAGEQKFDLRAPGREDTDPILDGEGRVVGRAVRRRWPLTAVVTLSATPPAAPGGAPHRADLLRVHIANTDAATAADAPRDDALCRSLLACHVLLGTDDGSFLSLLDPPEWAAAAARECVNVHTFPVLTGEPGDRHAVLSSPILLYDHPQVAPESPGDLHDATEIDEILSLRTLTLTDEEKREARGTDPRAAAILDRTESLSPEAFARLHGTIRTPLPESDGAGVVVAGVPVAKGSRVRLRPRTRGTDPQDRFLDGRTALVEAVMTDVDDGTHLAVTVEDDPAADLNQWYGRFRYFAPDEVEPLPAAADGEPR